MERLTAPSFMTGTGLAECLHQNGPRFAKVSIATPYFTRPGLELLLPLLANPKEGKTEVRLLVARDIISVAAGTLSLDALEKLLKRAVREGSGTSIRWLPQLHAKIYLFERPGRVAAIGSSNLTAPGLDGQNEEMNAVWVKSRPSFFAVWNRFEELWNRATPVEESTLEEWKGHLGLPTLKDLSRALDRARQLAELPVLSREGEEHQSYKVLKRFVKKASGSASWSSMVRALTSESKGDKGKEKGHKLEALVLAGLFGRRGDKVIVTPKGQEVVEDREAAYRWLIGQNPLVESVYREVAGKDGVTYENLTKALSTERKEIEPCTWWLASLGLVRRTGGGGGSMASWHPVAAANGARKTRRRGAGA